MENVSLHKSRALWKNELSHTKKILSQANYLFRKHSFAWSQRRKKAFIKEWGFLLCVMYQRGKGDEKSKAVKTKTNIILEVSCGEQHWLPSCLLISLIKDQDFTRRQASDPNIQHSNVQVSSTNVRLKRAWREAEVGFGRLQAKQSSGESNNYIWVFTDITKGRTKVHRKFKLRLWETFGSWGLFLNAAWMGQATVQRYWRENGRKQLQTTKNFTLEKTLFTFGSWKGSQVTSTRSWIIFSEHWHMIFCE